MDLMTGVGRLLAHADEEGTVSNALKEAFLALKDEAVKQTPIGKKVVAVLERLQNTDDPFYTDVDMMERVQLQQMAHSAVKMVELGAP